MATSNVRNVSQAKGNSKAQKTERAVQITVKRGDTVSALARKYGMKPDEFKQWVGLKSNNVQLGQKITLPNDVVPEGKGIMALARKYNMSLDEFGKLNNLPKPYKDYVASKGEKFYVKKKAGAAPDAKPAATSASKPAAKPAAEPAQAKPKPAAPKTQAKPKTAPKAKADPNSAAAAGAAVGAAVSTAVSNKAKWGSVYTPQELASKIYEGSKKNAAVGKPDFDALINEINPKNVEEVLKAYTKNESLINTITSEVMSGKQAREDAVMKIYDALAKAKGTPAKARTEFQTELHEQLHKLFGMADTEKLDATIDKMIDGKHTPKESKVDPVAKYISNGKLKMPDCGYIQSEVGFTVQKHAGRPPIPVDKKGNIVADVRKFNPTQKGPLTGKTIMVNAGHGWGGKTVDSASFKPGARYKDKNGKMLEEWYKARNYADNLIEELARNGATVIYTTGDAKQVCDAKEKFKSDVLISLHCNASDKSTAANGLKIIHDAIDSKASDDFAKIMETQFKSQVNPNTKTITAAETARGYVGLIDESNRRRIPALMIEMGFMSNPNDKLNIDSRTQRQLAMKNVTLATMKYLGLDTSKYNEQ